MALTLKSGKQARSKISIRCVLDDTIPSPKHVVVKTPIEMC